MTASSQNLSPRRVPVLRSPNVVAALLVHEASHYHQSGRQYHSDRDPALLRPVHSLGRAIAFVYTALGRYVTEVADGGRSRPRMRRGRR
jgi:hypothetical protein